jgi:hypothetical protein
VCGQLSWAGGLAEGSSEQTRVWVDLRGRMRFCRRHNGGEASSGSGEIRSVQLP